MRYLSGLGRITEKGHSHFLKVNLLGARCPTPKDRCSWRLVKETIGSALYLLCELQ